MGDKLLVLVVEDDMDMNELQRELLSVHGFDSIPAYSGKEALEILQRSGADAVILDLMLPEMDGFETCRRLRKSNCGRPVVVMVTALDSEDCRQQGFDAGADAYFTKPFDPDEVISTLRVLIEPRAEQGPR